VKKTAMQISRAEIARVLWVMACQSNNPVIDMLAKNHEYKEGTPFGSVCGGRKGVSTT